MRIDIGLAGTVVQENHHLLYRTEFRLLVVFKDRFRLVPAGQECVVRVVAGGLS